MKKIYTAGNTVEAHMVVHALESEGITATVQGENDPLMQPSVWIAKETDYQKAQTIISDIEKPNKNSERIQTTKPVVKGERNWIIVLGTVLFILLIAAWIHRSKPDTESKKMDTNGDGKIDTWIKYEKGIFTSVERDIDFNGHVDQWENYQNGNLSTMDVDSNKDGKKDQWIFYSGPGVISKHEHDLNFDGQVDAWETFLNGELFEGSYDNDGDGHHDEWVKYKHSQAIEKRWSYLNDKIIDKKAEYRHGRKEKEFYDHDRDGTFDEVIEFDTFERPIKKSKPGGGTSDNSD